MSPPSVVLINGIAHRVEVHSLDGLQIRALGALAPEDDVVVEGTGDQPDRILGDEDVLELTEEPVQIFSRPPTMFGRAL